MGNLDSTHIVLNELEQVEISKIIWNESLDWFPEELDASEMEQIQEQPSLIPWVVQSQKEENRFMLVDGYRRMRSLQSNKVDIGRKIECRIIPHHVSMKDETHQQNCTLDFLIPSHQDNLLVS